MWKKNPKKEKTQENQLYLKEHSNSHIVACSWSAPLQAFCYYTIEVYLHH